MLADDVREIAAQLRRTAGGMALVGPGYGGFSGGLVEKAERLEAVAARLEGRVVAKPCIVRAEGRNPYGAWLSPVDTAWADTPEEAIAALQALLDKEADGDAAGR